MLLRLKYITINFLSFFFESRRNLFLLLLLGIAPLGMLYIILAQNHPSSFTVMITNLEESSGGSGSIIATSKNQSTVLTNAHVCDVLNKSGGFVKKESGEKYLAVGYRKSEIHDLCVVTVAADLGTTVKLATKAPKSYSEATITGHPALLPNVINKGSFGERKVIQVLTGVKKCTKENINSQDDALYCTFFGLIPILTIYESITVSAMIMGGSSGSAVLNESGELAGVVFAGQGNGLSYAFIVPYEYVSVFLEQELKNSQTSTKVPVAKDSTDNTNDEFKKSKKKMTSVCSKEDFKSHKVCSILRQDLDI